MAWMVRRFRADLRQAGGMSGRQQRLQALLQKLGELGFRSMDPLRRQFVLNALAEMVQVPPATLMASMPGPRPSVASGPDAPDDVAPASTAVAEPATPRHRARHTAERNFLAAVLGLEHRQDVRIRVGDDGSLPLAEAFAEDHFDHADHRSLWTLLAARLESGKPFHVQDVVADTDVPTLKLLASDLYELGSRRNAQADALSGLQSAAADLDRLLRQGAEPPLSSATLDETTLVALLERRRREGHRPTAIARAVRGDARNATAAAPAANDA